MLGKGRIGACLQSGIVAEKAGEFWRILGARAGAEQDRRRGSENGGPCPPQGQAGKVE